MNKTLLLLFTLLIVGTTFSQEKKKIQSDDLIFDALRDEISRGMDSLRLPEHAPPFNIAFHYSQTKLFYLSASLGSIVRSSYSVIPSYSSRLMIGDYELTDENFESSSTFISAGETGIQISPPQETDYYGIRRSIWASTEGLFRSANMHYKIKKAFLSKNHISKENYFPSDLSREKSLIKRFEGPQIEYNKIEWKSKIKSLSDIFAGFPAITKSNVSLNIIDANIYYVNSEGFEIKIPYYFSIIQVEAMVMMKTGDNIAESLLFIAPTPDSLPNLEQLTQSVTAFANYTMELMEAPVLQEKYEGPIIFEGNAASKYLFQCLFNSDKSLYAKRIPLEDNSSNLYMPTEPPFNSIEAKIGKEIFHTSLTVTDISNQQKYKGKRMVGYYPVDAEGIIPHSNFILIQEGVLKNLFNSRIPSLSYSQSNGHKRAYITGQGHLGKKLSPGILKIESKNTYKEKKIHKKAKQYAKELDLDYYLIIKELTGESPVKMYKVDIKTGNETLLRGVKHIPHPSDALDFRGAFGNQENILQTLYSLPTTIISPSLFLLPKIEIFGVSRVEQNYLPIIKSPLNRE